MWTDTVCCWVTERENKIQESNTKREWRWRRYCIHLAFFMHLNFIISRPFRTVMHSSRDQALFLFDLYFFICHQVFSWRKALYSRTRSFSTSLHTHACCGRLRGSSTSSRLVYIDWSIQTRVREKWGRLRYLNAFFLSLRNTALQPRCFAYVDVLTVK